MPLRTAHRLVDPATAPARETVWTAESVALMVNLHRMGSASPQQWFTWSAGDPSRRVTMSYAGEHRGVSNFLVHATDGGHFPRLALTTDDFTAACEEAARLLNSPTTDLPLPATVNLDATAVDMNRMDTNTDILDNRALRRARARLWWLRRHPLCRTHTVSLSLLGAGSVMDLNGRSTAGRYREIVEDRLSCAGCGARAAETQAVHDRLQRDRLARLAAQLDGRADARC